MNKSKFLKRSLATLLAILMVVAMVPSVLAADEDAPEIFVDNRRATRDGNDYTITIYDTTDVLISWTPITGTKMSVVTKDKIEKDLDAKIYLPENAAFDGTDTYTLTLKEKVGKDDPIEHTLSITVKTTKPANNANLGGVRVDKTSGWYRLGYLDGTGSGSDITIPGYSNPVTKNGIKAHAIEGVVNNSNNTVTITLPFGMTPENVGFDDSAATGIRSSDTIKATAVFAPESVAARSKYTYFSTTKTGEVVVTAQSGATKTYKVRFVSEKVFESFENATNLKDLENVTKIKTPAAPVGDGDAWAKYTLKVNKAVADPSSTTATYTWIPKFEETENAQRIMGAGNVSRDTAASSIKLEKLPKAVGAANSDAEALGFGGTSAAVGSGMLRLVTSDNAKWDIGANQLTTDNKEYVYLLVRTKANPSGAYVEVELNAVKDADPVPRILEVQAANTMSSESSAFVAADAKTIDVVLSKEYSDNAGGSETQGDKTDISKVYLHVTTSHNAIVRIPSQEENETPVWSSSYNVPAVRATGATRHLLKNVNAKDKTVTIQVTDPNGKNERNYYINFRIADSTGTELNRVALYEKVPTYDGTYYTFKKVAESIKQADKTAPRELEIPYKYFTTAGDIDQHPSTAVSGSSLANLYLFIEPSDGAAVAPGETETIVDVDNVDVNVSKNHTCSTANVCNNGLSGNKAHIIENGATTLGDVWTTAFVKDNTGASGADFDDTLYITVSNAGANNSSEPYEIVLKRKLPLTEAEITSAKTNKALDADYIYSQANTLGRERAGQNYEQSPGTSAPNPADVGQAYIAAKDKEGNDLSTEIVGNDIIVTVPFDWDESDDTLYLTELKPSADTEKVYRSVFDTIKEASNATSIIEAAESVLKAHEQMDQTQNESDGTNYPRVYDGKVNRFKNLTEVGGGVAEENVLYAVSERNFWNNPGLNGTDPANLADLKTYSTAYEVHIKYAEDTSEERGLKNVTSANTALATASFDADYGLITVSVPNSTDWSDGYRADRSKNFKLNFETSADALVIDKYQKELNDKTASDENANGAGKASGRYEGATSAQKAEYKFQLNDRDQITSDTEFFVLNGELYIYDPLTGNESPVTGVGGKFTNNNWATIKTKQAEIQVYDENQNDMITYRLDLKVGPTQATSGDATLSSVKVGDYTATKADSAYTVTVPEGTDMTKLTLTVTATDPKIQGITVNGTTYAQGMTVDLTTPATIVVTAENGKTATYTLTAKTGTVTPPDPDKKPSSNYTDLPAEPMRTYVADAIDKGIISGTSSTKFTPRNNITRQDFALIVARADIVINNPELEGNGDAVLAEMISQYSGKPNFTDTEKLNDTYNAAIEYCVKKGIINGKGDGIFDPRAQITRLEAARVMSDWTKVTDETKTENTNGIKDWNKVNWGKHYVNSLYDAGILHGNPDGTFKPAGNLMRFEAAVMIMGSFDYINQSTTD